MIDIRPQDVVTTGGTQSRVALSEETVATYAEAMKNGAMLPPIVVFHDGSTYWLADGFHRLMAHVRNGADWIPADVRQGTRREAVLHSVGSNAEHGLPRTNADKRHAVMLLLNDEEWATWTNAEVARRCHVDSSTVDKYRKELSPPETGSDAMPAARKYTNKHGQTATMNTENIGRGLAGTRAEKTEAIRALAAEGYRSEQIASQVSLDSKTVRLYANKAGIALPDKAMGNSRRLDSRRVVEQTVLSMDACAQSINTVSFDIADIESSDLAEWLEIVTEAMAIFRKFHAQLKEATHV